MKTYSGIIVHPEYRSLPMPRLGITGSIADAPNSPAPCRVSTRESPSHLAAQLAPTREDVVRVAVGGGQESARLLALILASPRQPTAERSDSGGPRLQSARQASRSNA